MSDVQKLLAQCRELGAEFTPTPDGKLKVRAPAPLPEHLQEELRRLKAEVLALLTQQEPAPWLCPHCGQPAEIEAVEPSRDRQRTLTFWRCEPCQIWAVTPSTLREPPVWVSSKKQ
jgi:hypothetical protein